MTGEKDKKASANNANGLRLISNSYNNMSEEEDSIRSVERSGSNEAQAETEDETVYKITVKNRNGPFQIKTITKLDNGESETVFSLSSSNQVDQPSTSKPAGVDKSAAESSSSRKHKRNLLESIEETETHLGSGSGDRDSPVMDELAECKKDSKRARQDTELPLADRSESKLTNLEANRNQNLCNEQAANADNNNLSGDDESQDVDLSEVKLSKDYKKNVEAMSDSTKRAEESASSEKPAPAPVPPPPLNPNSDEYWRKIYSSDFFKQKSLKLFDIMNRELGYSKRSSSMNLFGSSSRLPQTPREFINKAMCSLNHVRRMKLLHTLDYHDGCVNSLNFNRVGTMLASGSDDFHVGVWDWARANLILTFDSGHKSNVFQTKFIPYTGDSQVVTCARDGQVRLALISSSGAHIGTKKLAKHADSCHKLSIEQDSSNLFLSAGEDGVVFEIDLRQTTPARILTVKSTRSSNKLPLYSISTNPANTYQFIVSGRDQFIRLYDKRVLVNEQKVLKSFSPLHMRDLTRCSVTSAVYNHDGTEIIGSYCDEDIYLFESEQDERKDAKYRYNGHRNSDTSVNFYGAESEFVVSGSDCGRIFFWEKRTQQIVNYLKGDERGIVNVLEPHPNFPILATSGLDNDVKIWSPTADSANSLDDLEEIVRENQRHRDTNRHFSLSSFEFELLLLLMNRPQNRVFYRTRDGNLAATTATTRSGQNEVDEEEEEEARERRRLRDRFFLDEDDEDSDAESVGIDNYFDYVPDSSESGEDNDEEEEEDDEAENNDGNENEESDSIDEDQFNEDTTTTVEYQDTLTDANSGIGYNVSVSDSHSNVSINNQPIILMSSESNNNDTMSNNSWLGTSALNHQVCTESGRSSGASEHHSNEEESSQAKSKD